MVLHRRETRANNTSKTPFEDSILPSPPFSSSSPEVCHGLEEKVRFTGGEMIIHRRDIIANTAIETPFKVSVPLSSPFSSSPL